MKPLREAESHGVRCRWNPVEKDVVTVDRADLIALCDSHDALATRCAAAEAERDKFGSDALGYAMEVGKLRGQLDAARAQVAALYRRALNQANGLTNYVDECPELRRAEKALAAIEADARALSTPTPTPQPEQDDA